MTSAKPTLIVTCLCLLSLSTAASAAERSLDFLDALRERGYYDVAEEYLDQLEARKATLPPEVRDVIPLEKALTLIEAAANSPGAQLEQGSLETALDLLQQFVKNHPDHPRAASANTQLGQAYVQLGRGDVISSKLGSNLNRKGELQQSARKQFLKAREVFGSAVEQYKAAFEKYPTFIDKGENPQEFEARRFAELMYLQSQYNLAQVIFYESETFDSGSEENLKLLHEAQKAFDEIYVNNSQMAVGLYARMWYGKCYEVEGKLREALGIYNELLGHPSDDGWMAVLKDGVQRFRLECLNARKDYQLVIQEADEWLRELRKRPERRGSRDHMGILWQRVIALECLAAQEDISENEKTKFLRDALDDLETIKLNSAEYRNLASEKERVIRASLNLDGKVPEDFSVALSQGTDLAQQIGNLNRRVQNEENSGDKQAAQEAKDERDQVVNDAIDMLQLALSLADEQTELKDLNTARYRLAYAYFFDQDHEYDAAVVSDFVARRYQDFTPEVALDSAYLAMTAYITIYQQDRADSPNAEEEDLIQPIMRTAELITTKWPKQDTANLARMRLGEFQTRLKQFDQAAATFQQVGESSDQYLEAQLKAGQAYWNGYIIASMSQGDQPVDEQAARAMLEKARQILVDSITKMQEKLSEGEPPSEILITAKATLASIYNETGDFPAAVKLLAEKPYPVLDAVSVKMGETRPERGITSARFATYAYQQAMRAYVGTRNIEQAQAVMKQLEGLGNADTVINQLVQLGKQLQEEVERLRTRHDPRLPEVIQSFEEFLQAMYNRENQTLPSMYWVGSTYFDLGLGLSDGKVPAPTDAVEKFARAAEVFEGALNYSEKNPTQVDKSQIDSLKLRLIKALHHQGKFELALERLQDYLATKPLSIDFQIEAAQLYTDWGAADPTNATKYLNQAINGVAAGEGGEKVIWGWGSLSQRLMNYLLQQSDPEKVEQYTELFAQARYQLAVSRRLLALAQSKTDEQVRLLELALLDVTSTVRAGADISGTAWWDKFDALNKDIYADLGRPVPADLAKPKSYAAVTNPDPEEPVAEMVQQPTTQPTGTTAAAPTAADSSSGNLNLIIAGVLTLAFAGGLGYWVFAETNKKKRRRYR